MKQSRRSTITATAMLCALIAAGCSGGGEAGVPDPTIPPPSSKPTLSATGVSLDYTDGGDAASGGISGDAGAAAGKFKNAWMTVELANGESTRFQIDDSTGKAHFVLCGGQPYTDPVHVWIEGSNDPANPTEYYDESLQDYKRVPPGETLHAVVPRVQRNIGITLLTEAAWQYLQAQGWSWREAARINEANAAVLREVNRFLPQPLTSEDMARLPYIVGDTTPDRSIGSGPNDVYGIVNSGVARAAGLLQGRSNASAWDVIRQVSMDLCDGRLDYKGGNLTTRTCNPLTPAPMFSDALGATRPSYLIPELNEFFTAGAGDMAARCGATTAWDADNARIVQVKLDTSEPYGHTLPAMQSYSGQVPAYSQHTPLWLLRKDGRLLWWNRSQPAEEFIPNRRFRQLISQGWYVGFAYQNFNNPVSETSVIKRSGSPLQKPNWSETFEGRYTTMASVDTRLFNNLWRTTGFVARTLDGTAERNETADYSETESTAAVLAGIRNVTSVGIASTGDNWVPCGHLYLATTAAGELWSSQATLPLARQTNCLASTPVKVGFQNDSPAFLLSTAGRFNGAFAIDTSGAVWGFGSHHATGLNKSVSTTLKKVSDFEPYGPIRKIECGHAVQCAALTDKGEMLVWGQFFKQSFDEHPEVLQTISAVRDNLEAYPYLTKIEPNVAGSKFISVGANGWSVYGLLDNGQVVVFPTTPNAPLFINLNPALPSLQPAASGCGS